jgi:hypothetical protein
VIIQASDLLKRLASGVRPDGADAALRSGAIEAEDFGSLLTAVQTGDIASGRTLQANGALRTTLNDDQMERLSVAADAAEAAGSRRLLAMIDGGAVTIDVPGRRIEEYSESVSGRVLTEIDGFVLVPEGRASEMRAMFTRQEDRSARSVGGSINAQPGLGTIRNSSIASMLESLGVAGRGVRGDEDRAAS